MATRNIHIGSQDPPNEQGHYGVNQRITVFYKENEKTFEGQNRSINYLWEWLEEVDANPPREFSKVKRQYYETRKNIAGAKTLEIEFKGEFELVKGIKESKAPYARIRYRKFHLKMFEPWRTMVTILNWILVIDKVSHS